ncbi:MAG: Trk family potassium uptake protein [Clostridia bacterium]|nr:Trk family potassium uptake protein [Clostridia bacterium]
MRKLSYSRIIAIGFMTMILLGTVLLMLPISSQKGEWTAFSDAFFTAVSAQCVTGLVVVDTATYWSLFGQIVIILLIQTGGLGFISIGVFFTIMLRRKLTLSQRSLFQESMNTLEVSGTAVFTKKIMLWVFIVESVGAVILTLCFMRTEPFFKALYYGIFHSISAFCNAGFSTIEGNLMSYSGDYVVNITVMALVTIGGLGFIVWDDVYKNKLNFKKYRLHTKIVLLLTVAITCIGALLLYISEKNTVLSGMSIPQAVTASFFNSVTSRTAGFNTVDLAQLSEAGKFIMMIIMFIGGSPGSTAGGIKTTTFMVIIAFLFANFTHTEPKMFGKRFEDDAVKKATAVMSTNLVLIVMATVALSLISDFAMGDIAYEAVSAMSTVGVTVGITDKFNLTGRFILAGLMYLGRIGSLTFAVSFLEKKKKVSIGYLPENISIG